MKKIIILTFLIVLSCVCMSFAVDNTKPETHNTQWVANHGDAANMDKQTCLSCHDERLECITCHEDVKPRNHNLAWSQKNHGLESRLNRMDCQTCHQQDFCSDCHDSAVPFSHSRTGFLNGSTSSHCQTSCQLPVGSWKNTVSKNCITCHQTRPMTIDGTIPHAIR